MRDVSWVSSEAAQNRRFSWEFLQFSYLRSLRITLIQEGIAYGSWNNRHQRLEPLESTRSEVLHRASADLQLDSTAARTGAIHAFDCRIEHGRSSPQQTGGRHFVPVLETIARTKLN